MNTAIAPRPESLNGLRIGLLANGKEGSADLLRRVARLLKERFSIRGVVLVDKGRYSAPAPGETLEQLADEADVVITATGE